MSDIKSNNPGIYCITNTANGKVYVGRATSICDRIVKHRWELRNNKHRNPFLQASWNEHGEAAFQFAVLEFCSIRKRGGKSVQKDVRNLASREHFWINHFGSCKVSKGFNIEGRQPSFYFFLVDEVMRSKGLNLEELMRSKGQKLLDEVTKLDLVRELADRMNFLFRGPKPRSKAAAARQDAARLAFRLKAANQTLDKVMSMDLDELRDWNAFHGRIANGWRIQLKTGKPNASIGISGTSA